MICIYQVYAWGDNDHGQQGSGSTSVNKKPALVHGLESVKVARVACGSSHSIAWTIQDSNISNVYEPVLFANSKDPLGTHFIGKKDLNNDETNISNAEGAGSGGKKMSRLSLSRILLSLDSNASKQKSLQHILNALQIIYAREAVVAAIAPHTNNVTAPSGGDKDPGAVSQINTLDSRRSLEPGETEESLEDVMDIAVGGGEAPACRGEVSSTSLSINTSPESEDGASELYPVFPGPSGTSSTAASLRTQSLPRGGTGRLSALVGAVIPGTKTRDLSKEFIVEERASVSGPSLPRTGVSDEFTRMFSLDDIRMLVDLLKLAVAGRCNDKAREAVAALLGSMGDTVGGISEMLLELSVTELEDVASNVDTSRAPPQPVIQESAHPYIDEASMGGQVRIPGAESLRIEFDRQCSTERRHDPLTISDATGRIVAIRSGRDWTDWGAELRVQGDELRWKFSSDGSVNGWGWR